MEKNDITLDQLNKATQILKSHNQTKDYQKLEEILPLVLLFIKSKREEISNQSNGTKFYAPIWVNALLYRLSTDNQPLPKEEYDMFRSWVAELSMGDYKSADKNLLGYEPVYTSPQDISEVILSLKHYFHLL